MKVTVGTDLANAPTGFMTAPAGRWPSKVLDVELRKPKADRKKKHPEDPDYDYLNWTCEAEFKDEKGAPQTAKFWKSTSLSPRAAGMLREFLDATGAPYTVVADPTQPTGSRTDFDTDDVLGRRFLAELSVQQKQGSSDKFNQCEKCLKLT